MSDCYKLEPGTLYIGDNLPLIRSLSSDADIDLIYLDPPFNSGTNYTRTAEDAEKKAFVPAFADHWSWSDVSEEELRDVRESGPRALYDLVVALTNLRGRDGLCAYLVMMSARLVHLHRALNNTGSLVLHCDPSASHYLKVILDALFGRHAFRNEIVWKRSHTRSSINRIFRRAHDVLLLYAKTTACTFNLQYRALSAASLKLYSQTDNRGKYQLVPLLVSGRRNGATGQVWRGIDPGAQGKNGMHWVTTPERLEEYQKQNRVHWPAKKGGTPRLKYYLEDSEGAPMSDVWDDIPPISSSSHEQTGYPTQKPEALLERIIRACTNEGDIVLDPFCGAGTSVVTAARLGRRWTGIDCNAGAVELTRDRVAAQSGHIPSVVRRAPVSHKNGCDAASMSG
jgi:site-specific DNA-methyltransferase (adenine-specific)